MNRTALVAFICASLFVFGCGRSTGAKKADAGPDATNDVAATEVASGGDAGQTGSDASPDAVAPDASADGASDIASSDGPSASDAPASDAPLSDASTSDAPVSDGGSDAAVCPPSEVKCVDATKLSVCSAAGDVATIFTCPTGCEAGACKVADLMNGWQVYQFTPADDSPQTLAGYTFESNGLVAIEAENAMPSAYVNSHVFASLHATGKISVQTTSDDDFIGFVFGWVDKTHFYFFDWKKAEQTDATCGLAKTGMTLKRMNATTEPATCDTYWSSAGTTNVSILSPTTGPGWVTGTVYTFDLVWKPGSIHITVKDGDTVVGTLTSNDAAITSGGFGFWNYSQAAVRYEAFTIEPSP